MTEPTGEKNVRRGGPTWPPVSEEGRDSGRPHGAAPTQLYRGQFPNRAEVVDYRLHDEPTIARRVALFAGALTAGMNVLDFGCGCGAIIGQVHAQVTLGPRSVGYEPDTTGVERARALFPALRFAQYQIGRPIPEPDGAFDAVLTSEVIEHVDDTRLIFREFARVLRPGGRLCLTCPYHGFLKTLGLLLTGRFRRHFHDPYGLHIRFYDRKGIDRVLADHGFRRVRFAGIGRAPFLWRSMFVVAEKV